MIVKVIDMFLQGSTTVDQTLEPESIHSQLSVVIFRTSRTYVVSEICKTVMMARYSKIYGDCTSEKKISKFRCYCWLRTGGFRLFLVFKTTLVQIH